MKKIGLVGGISWASTLDYYRYLNEGINRQLGGLNFAECLIYSVNFNEFQQFNADYNWDATFELLANAAQNLKKAGAEAIVLCANTAHIVADRVAENVGLPLIHITTATAKAVNKRGLKKIGLIGTSYTMELDFYKDKLIENGLTPIVPESQDDRDYIEDILRNELGRGIINPETKKKYLKIIEELINRGAEGIILGCTEIPLLIQQQDVSVPVFDTTKIHVEAAVNFALS
ncbi:aspartate/glutamate racemase family protein [Pedobacter nototheniae]|uniref:aspartate/glutamate racemase family protein n=1 Tax=Pedobacter nototheniae TaxID=2488994 RepID=UPI00292F3784|nr:aspartate/glutamate racemase family protein [Pedobacter nototheniae]